MYTSILIRKLYKVKRVFGYLPSAVYEFVYITKTKITVLSNELGYLLYEYRRSGNFRVKNYSREKFSCY